MFDVGEVKDRRAVPLGKHHAALRLRCSPAEQAQIETDSHSVLRILSERWFPRPGDAALRMDIGKSRCQSRNRVVPTFQLLQCQAALELRLDIGWVEFQRAIEPGERIL